MDYIRSCDELDDVCFYYEGKRWADEFRQHPVAWGGLFAHLEYLSFCNEEIEGKPLDEHEINNFVAREGFYYLVEAGYIVADDSAPCGYKYAEDDEDWCLL